ncbi:MAG: tetratricopeptide repeat protein, partial [Bacteroidota bacterium]
IKRLPASANYYSDRGVAHHLLGQYEQALVDFDRGVEMEPDNPFRYASRAFVKAKAGDMQGAMLDYEHALELDPEDAVAHNNLGMLQEQLGYQKKAEHHFKKADALSPLPPSAPAQEEGSPTPEKAPTVSKETQPEKPKMTGKFYAQTLKETFSSHEGFREFLSFLISKKKP